MAAEILRFPFPSSSQCPAVQAVEALNRSHDCIRRAVSARERGDRDTADLLLRAAQMNRFAAAQWLERAREQGGVS